MPVKVTEHVAIPAASTVISQASIDIPLPAQCPAAERTIVNDHLRTILSAAQ